MNKSTENLTETQQINVVDLLKDKEAVLNNILCLSLWVTRSISKHNYQATGNNLTPLLLLKDLLCSNDKAEAYKAFIEAKNDMPEMLIDLVILINDLITEYNEEIDENYLTPIEILSIILINPVEFSELNKSEN